MILLTHNLYRIPGGEDAAFNAEKNLLESKGHRVITFIEDNARLNGRNPLKVLNMIWSRSAYRKIKHLIMDTKPDVAHFHNTFFMISPSAYYACKEEGVPVVQTLHNYRLICPGALLMRGGTTCEDCVGKSVPWRGVLNACWRGSYIGTALVTSMLTLHRLLKTWQEKVDIYIALTEFAKKKFIEGGLPAEKIVVKPNFVYPDPGKGDHGGKYVLFVGRLSQEKGLPTLLRAWKNLKDIPIKIVGEGPLMSEIKSLAGREGLDNLEFLGRKPREEVFRLMKDALMLVFPSEWYEGFPMTIAEAFATGLPVVASRLGAMAEIVEDGRTGLLFEAGNPEDLADKVRWGWENPERMKAMGIEARKEFEDKYTAEKNYEMLMEIYKLARSRV